MNRPGPATTLSRLVTARRRVVEIRARRVPKFGIKSTETDPTVYYAAPDRAVPSGGIRVLYRHVDTLNSMGISAAVMHSRKGFRCTWFDNSTRVVAGPDVALGPTDVLVVPEWFGPGLHLIPPVPRLVVFNQRAYDTFDWISLEDTEPGAPYGSLPSIKALLTVSEDNVAYLRIAFPEIAVHLVRNVIDKNVFHPGARLGEPVIAVMPSRRQGELLELQHMLRRAGIFDRFPLRRISNLSESSTALALRSSAMFLSLSEREGFGLPPAEAMASGCYTVGFTGLAGREFFRSDYSVPVADGDMVGLARAVVDACTLYETEPATLRKRGLRASEAILERYSTEGLRSDLCAFYEKLLV